MQEVLAHISYGMAMENSVRVHWINVYEHNAMLTKYLVPSKLPSNHAYRGCMPKIKNIVDMITFDVIKCFR